VEVAGAPVVAVELAVGCVEVAGGVVEEGVELQPIRTRRMTRIAAARTK
jgi:hypothetical protein